MESYFINRDNSNSVTNPVYSDNLENTNKDFMIDDEHIYDSISYHGEEKAEAKSVASSIACQHHLQNPYDEDDRVSIKSDDVSCDQTGDYSEPCFKTDGAHFSEPKLSPKPRYVNNTDVTPATDVQSIDKNITTNDDYILHDARQKVNDDEYVLHDAKQRVATDEYVSLNTAHTFESEEYITQAVSSTVEGNGYASVDITKRTVDNDYQEIVQRSSPPPGYSIPSNIPASQ